jgi:hypothetical protein
MLALFGAVVAIASPFTFLAYHHPAEFRRQLAGFVACWLMGMVGSVAWLLAVTIFYIDSTKFAKVERLTDLGELAAQHQVWSGAAFVISVSMLAIFVVLERWVTGLKGSD